MENKRKLIEITHFINPSTFWFKYESSSKEFDSFHKNLTHYYNQHQTSGCHYSPQLKEIVAVFYSPVKKWIRGKVYSIIESQKQYIIWAIDYGIPVLISQKDVQKLSEEHSQIQLQNVYFGCVTNLIPASLEKNEIVPSKKWSEYSIEYFKQLIQHARLIYFIEKSTQTVFIDENEEIEQIFGDIEFILNINDTKPKEHLIQCGSALHIPDEHFFNYLKKYKLNQNLLFQSYDERKIVSFENVENIKKYEQKTSNSDINDFENRNEQKSKKNSSSRSMLERLRARVSSENRIDSDEIFSSKQKNSEEICNTSFTLLPSKNQTNKSMEKFHNEKYSIDDIYKKDLVLVHGVDKNTINRINDADFTDSIHNALKNMRINHVYRTQQYAWPHIMRGNSEFIINNARTGKTMSYLPALFSLIEADKEDCLLDLVPGASVIIIAPTSIEVDKIYRLCLQLTLNNTKKISIVQFYGLRKKESACVQILNGCDVLITTPSSLVELLSFEINLFDLNKLRRIVIDNMDLSHKHILYINTIIKKLILDKPSKTVQLIVTSKYWHDKMFELLDISEQPQLCIGAHIEVMPYTKSIFRIETVMKSEKINEIQKFIKEHPYDIESLMIICNCEEDVMFIVKQLRNYSEYVTYAVNANNADEISLAKKWNHGSINKNEILVCTDDVLRDLNIYNVQNLIHYSIPNTWSKFSYRFTVFFKFYDDLIINKKYKEPHAKSTSLILLDETNNSQLPRLYDFLIQHGEQEILKNIDSRLVENSRYETEMKRIKENRAFCQIFMTSGKCNDQNVCQYRHILTQNDKPHEYLPTKGIITVKVLKVISAAHFRVQIVQENDNNQNYTKFNLKFQLYFNNKNNHQIHWPINFNDVCAIEKDGIYHRCKILEINKNRSKTETNFNCTIKLVDTGDVFTCKSMKLLTLPDEFKIFPYQAINLLICGIVPRDFEQEWSSDATFNVKEWIRNFENNVEDGIEIILKAQILFTIMDTIWADKVFIQKHLKTIATNVKGIDIQKSLIDKKFADISYEPVDIIRSLAYKCGILKSEANSNFKNTTLDTSENDNSSFSINDVSIDVEPLIHEAKTSTENTVLSDLIDLSTSILQNNSMNSKSDTSKSMDCFAMERAKIRRKPTEKWDELKNDDFTNISITNFYTPNHFYVQNLDNDQSKVIELENIIKKYIESNDAKLISKPDTNLNCLAKCDEYYERAKITQIACDKDETIIKLFFCDIGRSETRKINEIYESTPEISTFIPFQAIRCKLIGIQPKANGIWTGKVCDEIYDDFIEPATNELFVKVINKGKTQLQNEIKCWRYEVVLIHCTKSGDININKEIVKKGLGVYDPETEQDLELNILNESNNDDEQSKSEELWEDDPNFKKYEYKPPVETFSMNTDNGDEDEHEFDVQISDEHALEMLNSVEKSNIFPKERIDLIKDKIINKKSKELIPLVKIDENKNDSQIEQNIVPSSIVKRNENDEKCIVKNIPRLRNIWRHTNVVWQQSESLICLKISAADIEDYELQVTSTSLFFLGVFRGEEICAMINFFGIICPEMTSHEQRGLNVVVRLFKSIGGLPWPRLTADNNKHSWLKYNFEAIAVENETFLQNIGKDFIENNNSINISSDDDSIDSNDEFNWGDKQGDNINLFEDEFEDL